MRKILNGMVYASWPVVATIYLHFVPGSHHRALGTFWSGKSVFNNTNEYIYTKTDRDNKLMVTKGDSEVGERQIRSMGLSDTNHYTL